MNPPTWQRQVMHRVGVVLILIGVADIVACGFAVAKRMSYGSSLNIFVLVAGVMVYRGHVGAIRWVVHMFSFMLGGFLLLPIITTLVVSMVPSLGSPFVPTTGAFISLLSGVALIALLLWVRQSLARLPVFEGNRPARPFLRTPETAVGAALAIILGGAVIALWKTDVLR